MFSGLTNRQLMELAVIALKNVIQYTKDVQLLIEHESCGRALSLSILGIEEFAKGMLLKACSYDYLSQEEIKILLKRERITNHNTKLNTALDYTITMMLASWSGEELERALKSNDPIKLSETINIWEILHSKERDEILNRTEEGKLLLKALEIRKSDLFEPRLLNRKKQNGFYVDLNVNPLNTTHKDVKPYFEYLSILDTLASQQIRSAIEMLNNEGLHKVFRKHYSKLREEVENIIKQNSTLL